MRVRGLNRRQVLQAGVAGTVAMASPRRPARAAAMPFTVVLESEVVIVDPHMTTAAITRTFGYHIFDTLFSMDSKGRIHPQMVGDYSDLRRTDCPGRSRCATA